MGVIVSLALGTIAAIRPWVFSAWTSRQSAVRYATSPVRRVDLNVTMTTGGRVESYEKTIVECQIENVDVRVRGYGTSMGGSTTILSVVPDGSTVKKGDVLCVLDSSLYEELVRLQQMNVDRARADLRQADLNLEVARTAVEEYKDGIMAQTLKNLRGRIALSESDVERATDRLEWSRKMVTKGYLSQSQVLTEEFGLKRLDLSLRQGKTALRMFEQFNAPKYLKILDSEVKMAEAVQNYQQRRVQRFEERLDHYKKQVAYCTIRAPHDGFVIYYNEDNRDVRIEPGLTVRQKQKLFYLPDLGRMEVDAMLHESVVKDVRPGMRAKVRVEGLPNREMEGHVESVTQLPTQHWYSDVKYFVGIVKLDSVPRGLRPGMTAEVELVTARKSDVLAMPAEALAVEDGRSVCYIAHENGLERREIKLGKASKDLIEVTEGLDEGETVVLEPSQVTGSVEVAEAPAAPEDSPAAAEAPAVESASVGL
ncbi:MAG: efflux RND transporter periplasmic adaptor subunit [Isosphaeraceae bacterium]